MANQDTSGRLFSEEEMNGGIKEQNNCDNEPVVCLGIEFKNDNARREYFRAELRKKLPELRKLEGFPIGEDDDIINLSDPPYYTACPNPWLNDFIKHWENEKKQLELEGKRKADFEIKEPYASDVSIGRGNPIYMAHTYHTKVPHPAIMRYILRYTQPGDIIFDGFAGSGMTGFAAHMCGHSDLETKNAIDNEFLSLFKSKANWGRRHAICSDLSPYASFIAYNYNTALDAISFSSFIKNALHEIENEYGWMYNTRHSGNIIGKINYVVWSDVMFCPYCGKEFLFYDVAVDEKKKEMKETFECPHCKAKLSKKEASAVIETYYDGILERSLERIKTVPAYIKYQTPDKKYHKKKPDDYDFAILNKIASTPIPAWIPVEKIPIGVKTNDPIKSHFNYIHQLYTKRNLIIASAIKEKAERYPILNMLITSYLNARGTKMTRYKLEKAGNAMLNGTLYVASLTAEQNLFDGFKGKISDFEKVYSEDNRNIVNIESATNLSIDDNSIDYIFTDPPFGANIMYSELNVVNEAWLKIKTNNKKEAIINAVQRKNLFDYQNLMIAALKEYYRVLKPGKWITIEFSNTSASVWNSIQNALQSVGFVVANVASLDKKQGSFNAITSTTAVKQDLVITCYKPSSQITYSIEIEYDNKKNIWDFIYDHLEHLAVHIEKGAKTTTVIERSPKILYDRLISYYVQHGLPVPIDAQEFQLGLRERFVERDGMFFTATQAVEYEEKRKHTEGVVPMGIMVSDEANGIEWLKNLLRNNPKTYQEINPEWMQAINGLRKGDVLPELRDILEENFIQEPDGKWRIADPEKQADLDKLYMKNLMKEFNIYVEAANKPKAKPIKQVRIEAVRAGFRDCYKKKDFATIIKVGDKIPQNLLQEDEQLLRYYDVATRHV